MKIDQTIWKDETVNYINLSLWLIIDDFNIVSMDKIDQSESIIISQKVAQGEVIKSLNDDYKVR